MVPVGHPLFEEHRNML